MIGKVYTKTPTQNTTKISNHFKRVESNRRAKKKYAQRHYKEQRQRILGILGGKCVKCGFGDARALQIDHINGGGTKENKALGPARYSQYLKTKCEGLQLLCANCNMIKKFENKEHPYRKEVIV